MGDKKNLTREEAQKKGRLQKWLDFSLDRDSAVRWIPFIMYLTFWAVIYIANRHHAQKAELEVTRLKDELKELRAEYLTTKAGLMEQTKQSEISKLVNPYELKELSYPPKILEIKEADEH